MAKKAKKKATPISDQLRQVIETSGLTRYRIWKETGISQATLSEFINGNRSLSLANIDKLGELLDLTIVPGRKPQIEKEG
jgi:plasmid maintenance system antidote protein VapI